MNTAKSTGRAMPLASRMRTSAASAIAILLWALPAAAQAQTATILSMTGPVVSETYHAETPFDGAAETVALFFAFEGAAGSETSVPSQDGRALLARIEVLDADGRLLASASSAAPTVHMINDALGGARDQLRLGSGARQLEGTSPFTKFEIFLQGDGAMFESASLAEISGEALQSATTFAGGALASGRTGAGLGGIVFEVDLASIRVAPARQPLKLASAEAALRLIERGQTR